MNIDFSVSNDILSTSINTVNLTAVNTILQGYTSTVVNVTSAEMKFGITLTPSDSGKIHVFSEQISEGGAIQLPTPVGNPGLKYIFRSNVNMPFVGVLIHINIEKGLNLLYGSLIDLSSGSPNTKNILPESPRNAIRIKPGTDVGGMYIVLESDGVMYHVNGHVVQIEPNLPCSFVLA